MTPNPDSPQPTATPPPMNPFTRRSFMKTSALTIGAAAVLSQGMALATEENNQSSGMLLICSDEPSSDSYDIAWPHTLSGAKRQHKIEHRIDHRGECVNWDLYHWVETNCPRRKDSVSSPGEMEGRSIAHLLITRSFWTYHVMRDTQPDIFRDYPWVAVRDQWVTRTVVHLTCGGLGQTAENFLVQTNFAHEISYSDMSAASNNQGVYELSWNGEVLGWVAVSIHVSDFKLRSDAFFMPKDLKTGFSYGGNLSVTLMNAVEVGGTMQNEFSVQEKPPHSPITLNWSFLVRASKDDLREPDPWVPRNPGIVIPPVDTGTPVDTYENMA